MSGHDASFADGKRLVLEATDIVRLIGETVKLKRAGRRYVGLCPFHNEKSPSFSVDPDKRFFYCFGCKKGGNAIDFVIERDRSDFKDALQTLADWAGVELPKTRRNPELADKRQRLLDAHSAAGDVYRKLLRDPVVGKAALDYLHGRGFDDETIKRFGLGFAPDAWDTLARHDLLKKFPAPLLEEGGLLKPRDRDKGGGYYDTFRARVIFPIRDEQGRPIAFGGRVLPGGDSPAKYLNSPETPLFAKGRVLYGLDLAKKRIVETRTAIVFEGYADATMAHQFGVTNAVAVLGTALTPDHAQTLRRLADKIVLLFDADAAGGMAAMRSVELFLREPVEIAVADLPDGLDPDEFLQRHGVEAFNERVERAPDALEYRWRQLQRQFKADASVTGRQKAIEAYLASLAEARGAGPVDPMRWGAVVARVGKLLGMRPEELNRHFAPLASARRGGAAGGSGAAGVRAPTPRAPAGYRQRPFGDRPRRGKWREEPKYVGPRRSDLPAVETDSADARAEAHLLGALFNDPHLWQAVQAHATPDDFTDRRYRWLAEQFWEHLRNEGEPTFAEWLDAIGARFAGENERAARAKAACIELAERAEALGDAKRVAAEAVGFFAKRRRDAEVNEQLMAARMGGSTEAGGPEPPADGSPRPGKDPGDEAALLRQLEQTLRAAGRAGGTKPGGAA